MELVGGAMVGRSGVVVRAGSELGGSSADWLVRSAVMCSGEKLILFLHVRTGGCVDGPDSGEVRSRMSEEVRNGRVDIECPGAGGTLMFGKY
jgi:hypothetical protein